MNDARIGLFLKGIIIFLFFWCCGSKLPGQNYSLAKVKLENFESDNYWKLSNGLVGIILVKEKKIGSAQAQKFLAPIQSLIYADGTFSDESPNFLVTATDPVSIEVTVVKNDGDECVIRYYYSFKKKQFYYGKKTYKGGDAGNGFYKATIRLRKDAKSIMIEEESDYDIFYSIKISNGIRPDKARYRGWSAISKDYGYEPSGQVYRAEHERGYPLDATVDLNINKPFVYPKLVLWEPAGGENNSGRYWIIYNSKAKETGNIMGFFQGKPSKLFAVKETGPRLRVYPADRITEKEPYVSIDMAIDRLAPDQSFATRRRFEWGIFIGTQKDILDPAATQPIAIEMNQQSGISKRVDNYITKGAQLVPAFYKGAIYLPEEKIQLLIKKVKNDQSFYEKVCSIDGLYKPVFDAWRFPDSAKSLLKSILQWNNKIQKEYKNGEGSYAWDLRYWKGAINFKFYALASSFLFAGRTIEISPADKKEIEQMLALMARVVWDEDNTPTFDSSGINLGPENMIYMYQNNARYFFALLYANDPEFSVKSKAILNKVKSDLDNAVYNNGSSFGNPHYIQATMDPLLFTMLQLKQAGIANLFKNNTIIYRFVDFFKSLLTPPSVRFNGYRKLISFGDGSEESTVTFGLLAAGLEDSDKKLSDELYTIFENGAPHLSIYGPLSLSTDISQQHTGLSRISTSNFTGYLTHLRYNVNTPNETAIWILNGDSLYDHRTDDAGEIAIYALGAPLSVGRSCFYYPSATDARIKSVVVPHAQFPEWSSNAQPINIRSLTNRTWPISEQISFANLGRSSVSESLMQSNELKWVRRVTAINSFNDRPLIIIYDSVSGSEGNIWSMFFSSEGPIQTPMGSVEPVEKIYDNNNRKELPQGTVPKKLNPGWSYFHFTGQKWNHLFHTAGGINWSLSFLSKVNTEFSLAQWTTTWQNDAESREFQKTNNKPYADKQQILRLKSSEPITAVITPFRKGIGTIQQPIKQISPGYHLFVQNKDSIVFTQDGYYSNTNDTTKLFALFLKDKIFSYNYVTMAGGPLEIEATEKFIKIRVHGGSGTRKIKLPFSGLKLITPSSQVKSLIREQQTEITISYINPTMDLLSSNNSFTEWIWSR